MDNLPRHYRYQYRLTLFAGNWKHSYELIGRHGGLHFHVSDMGEEFAAKYGNRYSAGLEVHCRLPPDYMRNDPPSHDECWLLKQPCWHDGTSLYAQETLVPIFLHGDHVAMFRFLAGDADDRFASVPSILYTQED